MAKKPLVAILMGSDSDMPVMSEAAKFLDENGIAYELKILSAHRSPDDVVKFSKSARGRGFKVIIAGAGAAAHLAGVIASHTTLPVIGVPMQTSELKGIDSLFSTVQMPSGVPVATVSIGRSGAKNAAILALQILSLSDKALENRLAKFKEGLVKAIREKNRRI